MSNGYHTTVRRMRPLILAATSAGLMGIGAVAQADMKLSLQFTDSTSTHTFVAGDVGTPLEIDVWAQITPNPTFDGGASGQGNGSAYTFLSAPYVVLSSQVSGSGGGLSSAALEAWANFTGSTNGVIGDTNSDGANDLGTSSSAPQSDTTAPLSINNGGSSPYSNGSTNIPAADQQPLSGGGFEFLIEKLFYTATANDLTSGRVIDYTLTPPHAGKTTANWVEDGNQDGTTNSTNDSGTANKNVGNLTGSTIALVFGASVGNTPEPASIGLLGLGAVGLMSRRRKA